MEVLCSISPSWTASPDTSSTFRLSSCPELLWCQSSSGDCRMFLWGAFHWQRVDVEGDARLICGVRLLWNPEGCWTICRVGATTSLLRLSVEGPAKQGSPAFSVTGPRLFLSLLSTFLSDIADVAGCRLCSLWVMKEWLVEDERNGETVLTTVVMSLFENVFCREASLLSSSSDSLHSMS